MPVWLAARRRRLGRVASLRQPTDRDGRHRGV
jgi:hypothetical protein